MDLKFWRDLVRGALKEHILGQTSMKPAVVFSFLVKTQIEKGRDGQSAATKENGIAKQ